MNQADLAQLAGTSRESVSRFLAVLERAGVVRVGRGRVTVRRAEAAALLHLLSRWAPLETRGPRTFAPAGWRWSSGSWAPAGSPIARVLDRLRDGATARVFVAEVDRDQAYADKALSIPGAQTISQPYMVAAIAEALELAGSELLLEVGTGSGYSAAILALLAGRVISVERLPELAASARDRLTAAGVINVEIVEADGSLGAPEEAPFDAIAVHARVPGRPQALLAQLAPGGRLVAPIASGLDEMLTRFRRTDDGSDPEYTVEELSRCRFVPLIGSEGYRSLTMTVGPFVLNFYSPLFVDQLKRGRKTATIRLGDKSRKYQRGQVVWITVGYRHGPREKIFAAVIDDVEVKQASEISPRDIEHDNPEFRRIEETTHFLEQIYGRAIDDDDIVTVIRFSQIVERPVGSFGNGEPPSPN